MRYEKKFIINQTDYSQFKIFLSKINFIECFPKRKISSLYYDTNDLKLFKDSENGISRRKKIRIRWYNNDLINAKIEYKIKKSELGDKKFYNLSNFNKNELSEIYFLGNEKSIPSYLLPKRIDNHYFPTSLISYNRNYFLKKNLRITFDSSIYYYAVTKNSQRINVLHSIPSEYSVLEMKYDQGEDHLLCQTIQQLTDKLGLTLTRFSKYSNSIRLLYY